MTFHVDAACITVGENGLWLGGDAFGGIARAHLLSDDDGDGVWSVTLGVERGLSGNYVFLNSPTNDHAWSTGENEYSIDPDIGLCAHGWCQDCADVSYFGEWTLAPVTNATVISTCFGECRFDGYCTANTLVWLPTPAPTTPTPAPTTPAPTPSPPLVGSLEFSMDEAPEPPEH